MQHKGFVRVIKMLLNVTASFEQREIRPVLPNSWSNELN